jgi:hypothetical protein
MFRYHLLKPWFLFAFIGFATAAFDWFNTGPDVIIAAGTLLKLPTKGDLKLNSIIIQGTE